jgi:hypothetical protein
MSFDCQWKELCIPIFRNYKIIIYVLSVVKCFELPTEYKQKKVNLLVKIIQQGKDIFFVLLRRGTLN